MNDIVKTDPLTRDLIEQIAFDVGKDLVCYLEGVYPKIFETYPQSGFKLSLRNHVHNCIMNLVKQADKGTTEEWLKFNEKHRRDIRKMRKAKTIEEIEAIRHG